jgi:hypothetical protein
MADAGDVSDELERLLPLVAGDLRPPVRVASCEAALKLGSGS